MSNEKLVGGISWKGELKRLATVGIASWPTTRRSMLLPANGGRKFLNAAVVRLKIAHSGMNVFPWASTWIAASLLKEPFRKLISVMSMLLKKLLRELMIYSCLAPRSFHIGVGSLIGMNFTIFVVMSPENGSFWLLIG